MNKTTDSDKTNDSELYFSYLLKDIYSMMNFARESGIEIPGDLRVDIATLLSGEKINNDILSNHKE